MKFNLIKVGKKGNILHFHSNIAFPPCYFSFTTVPEAPEDLTVVSDARYVSVEWKQPSDISKGPIDGYLVTCNSTDRRKYMLLQY